MAQHHVVEVSEAGLRPRDVNSVAGAGIRSDLQPKQEDEGGCEHTAFSALPVAFRECAEGSNERTRRTRRAITRVASMGSYFCAFSPRGHG